MNSVEIIKTWWQALTLPDNTVKNLSRKKIGAREGVLSITYLSLIFSLIGILALLATTGFSNLFESIKIGVIGFVLLIVFGIVALYLFSWFFTKIMKKHKGKAKMEKIIAIYGLFIGIMIVSMIPYAISYSLYFAFSSIPLLGYFLLGLGVLASTAYAGRATGVIIETLVNIEKVSINKVAWVQGAAMGMVYLVFLTSLGAILQVI